MLGTLLRRRISILIILSYTLLIVLPLSLQFGDVFRLENNLALADLARSSLLYLFDTFLLLFVTVVPIGLLVIAGSRRRLKRLGVLLIVLLLVSSTVPFSTHGGTQILQTRKPPLASKVFIITFDGTRADAFWEYATFIINHRNESAWAYRIVCTYPTITYPNHVSLFTGTWPQIHGTEANAGGEYSSVQFILRKYRPPREEDIFEVAERYGILTAIFAAPTNLASILGASNTYRRTGGLGAEMMNDAINFIETHKDDIEKNGLLAWIHLVDPDEAGHQAGSDSTLYHSTIRRMAELVGELYQKIHDMGWENDTVIIVTADHGMIGQRHFGVWPPLVADIPLWMWGAPFRHGVELGGGRIIDIAPTVAFILGVPPPKQSKGIVLYRAFNETYVKSIRGDNIDLEAEALSALKHALRIEYLEILKWGVLCVTMMWSVFLSLIYALKYFRKLRRELIKRGLT
ncbi:MAG: alkaline phosphatase family protein [Candidatus Njordarchaeales archaeon]